MRPLKNKTAFMMILGFLLVWINPGFSFSEEIRYQSGDRRDPFIPVNRTVASEGVATGDIQVEGIIYDSKGKSIVVIHGEPYKAGDKVGEYTVVAIHPSRIIVSLKGKETEYWISAAEKEIAEKKKKEALNV